MDHSVVAFRLLGLMVQRTLKSGLVSEGVHVLPVKTRSRNVRDGEGRVRVETEVVFPRLDLPTLECGGRRAYVLSKFLYLNFGSGDSYFPAYDGAGNPMPARYDGGVGVRVQPGQETAVAVSWLVALSSIQLWNWQGLNNRQLPQDSREMVVDHFMAFCRKLCTERVQSKFEPELKALVQRTPPGCLGNVAGDVTRLLRTAIIAVALEVEAPCDGVGAG